MGIFHEQVEIVNRAPVDLTVIFDGQSKTLKPGKNIVPKAVVQYAKNQNPIKGSQDPNNPHISGARYLVGIPSEGDDCTPLSEEEWNDHLDQPSRINAKEAFLERYGGDPKARLVVQGKGKKSTATSRIEAGGNPRGESSFEHERA